MGSYERPLPLAAGNQVPGQGATTLCEVPFSGELNAVRTTAVRMEVRLPDSHGER